MRARIPPVQSKEELRVATLRLVPASGQPLEITQDQVLLGRDPGCDVVLNDGSVSRRHARIEKRGTVWAVVDQGSANGTFLDSNRVSDAVLRTGQDLRLGSVAYRVEIEGEVDTGATIGGSPDATVVQPVVATMPPPRVPAPPPIPPPPPRPTAPVPAAPPPPPPSRAAKLEPTSPVPAMDAGAPPPPKKGKGPFFWLATGCFGCLTMVILVMALVGGGLYMSMRGPIDAVKGELADIRRGDLDAAYDRLSEEYKRRLSRDDFERAVAIHPGLKDVAGDHFWSWSVHVVNHRGRVNGQVGGTSGPVEIAVFRLAKESGDWRIAGIELGGTDLSGADAAPDEPTSDSQ